MGRNRRSNRFLQISIDKCIGESLRHLDAGRATEAQISFNDAAALLRSAPSETHFGWASTWANYEAAKIKLTTPSPCRCLYCSLSDEQKIVVDTQVPSKVDDLAAQYENDRSNFIGAYAEVAFGVTFGLAVNQVPGFDGGKDFVIPCSVFESGALTIDVKATSYAQYLGNSVRCNFPYQRHWISRPDHIYVLCRVTDQNHVFYHGFAFGNDPCFTQVSIVEGEKVKWLAPLAKRSKADLADLLEGKLTHLPKNDVKVEIKPRVALKQGLILRKARAVVRPLSVCTDRPESPKPDADFVSPYKSGDAVNHPRYGVGILISEAKPLYLGTLGMWDWNVTVEFQTGKRNFAAKLAELEFL